MYVSTKADNQFDDGIHAIYELRWDDVFLMFTVFASVRSDGGWK